MPFALLYALFSHVVGRKAEPKGRAHTAFRQKSRSWKYSIHYGFNNLIVKFYKIL